MAVRQRRIQRDRGELPPQQCVLALFAQAHGQLRRPAQAQERHLVDPRQQGIQRLEMREQDCGRLRADAGDPRDVVHRVAGERQVVGDLVRMHAVPRLDAVAAPALALGEVVLLVVHVQQLREVLVGGHDHAAVAVPARAVHGAADQVVGLVVVVGQGLQPQRLAQALAPGELAAQLRRRGVAVGLVGRVQRVAEAGVQRLVEGDGDVPRAFALQQLQQEAGEAVHRVGRPAVGVVELVRHGMPGAEHVHRGVDEVQRRRGWRVPGGHAPVQSDSRVAGSGRSRSGASTSGVPIAMVPTSCSSSASPRVPSRKARS